MSFKPKPDDDAVINVALSHYLHDLEHYGAGALIYGKAERQARMVVVRDLLRRRTGEEIPTQP